MKILHIIPTYKPATGYGGPIVSIGLLCENLVKYADCDVTVAATNANVKADLPVHSRTPVLVDGVKVYYFRRITPDHSQLSPSLLWWFWRNMKQFDAIHIHSWWNLTVLCATTLCLLRGVKPVFSPRGMLSSFSLTGRFKPVFQQFIGKKLLKNTFLHATSAQEAAECSAMIPNWKHQNLPNFLDLRSGKNSVGEVPNSADVANIGNDNAPLRLLFLSRIHPKKGIELLFDALAEVPFEWSLTMAGDGDLAYLEELKKRAEKLHISLNINWLGWINTSERWAIFEQSDLLVLPSYNENFANVVIESLAVGTPVLVSKYVGLSDYVLAKNLGWVCDTTVESIRDALTNIEQQPTQRLEISNKSACQIRADWDPSVLATNYVKMYKNM
jgi:glycosyltransferase involved in cell wall biosynthesis